jgi:hypothetical protein
MSTKRINTPPEVDDMLINLSSAKTQAEDKVKFYESRHPELVKEYADFQAKQEPWDGPSGR